MYEGTLQTANLDQLKLVFDWYSHKVCLASCKECKIIQTTAFEKYIFKSIRI